MSAVFFTDSTDNSTKMIYSSMERDLYMKMYENNESKEVINSDGAKVLAISWCFYTCFYLYVCYL